MNPPPYAVPPQPVSTSGKAITSLVFGILTFLCLGPFAAVIAIIFGHLALGAINRAGGMLGGKGMAIAGLVMGYVGFIPMSAILLSIALPPILGARDVAKQTAAQTECRSIVAAIRVYKTEYGRLPAVALAREDADTTVAENNDQLFNILRAIDAGPNSNHAANPRRVAFFDGRQAPGTPPKGGFGSNGVLYDPWGTPYFIRLDLNGDGYVDDPYGGKPLQEEIVVWSYGRDRQPGASGHRGPKGDVISWHTPELSL